MSTPFDLKSASFLNDLVQVFKIASADITNIPLLRYVGSLGKPVILSTGASTLDEIERATSVLAQAGAPDVVILHCVLSYPTEDHDANLLMIRHLQRRFPTRIVGLSDHTRPSPDNHVSVIAYALGARVIEKHFTLDKKQGGNDHYHSMDTNDLRHLVSSVELARISMGSSIMKEPIASEMLARQHARRSICASRDLPAGHILQESDLLTLRPVAGVPASEWDHIVGHLLLNDLSHGQPLQWSDVAIDVKK
jgi:N-acetylneuraminate synthase